MTDCAAPRHGQPAEAEPHAHLCRPCRTGLRRDLLRLPALDADLEELPGTRRSDAGTVRGHGAGLPFHEKAAECRSQLRHDVNWWCRELSAIGRVEAVCVPLSAACEWLAEQRWVAYREFAGDMAQAFREVRGRAVALLDPMPRAEIPIPADSNWCPACEVPGAMVAVVYQSLDDRRPSMVWCGACDSDWDATQWLRLGDKIVAWRDGKAA